MKKKLFAILLALVMLLGVLPVGVVMAEEEPIFSDLNVYAWYYTAVEYVCENNIFSGTGNGLFEPNKEMTRAMLVSVMYRLDGAKAEGQNPFVDVADNAWYAPAVIWASKNGIVSGVDKTHFAPEANLTREQLAVIIHRYVKTKGIDDNRNFSMLEFYKDRDEMSAYATEAIDFMIKQGFMTGKTVDTFNPKDTTTRAEVAMIITLISKQLL